MVFNWAKRREQSTHVYTSMYKHFIRRSTTTSIQHIHSNFSKSCLKISQTSGADEGHSWMENPIHWACVCVQSEYVLSYSLSAEIANLFVLLCVQERIVAQLHIPISWKFTFFGGYLTRGKINGILFLVALSRLLLIRTKWFFFIIIGKGWNIGRRDSHKKEFIYLLLLKYYRTS